MNYSLFIMVMKEMMSMEEKGQPGEASAASPSYPHSLQIYIIYFVFLSHPIVKYPKGSYI
jgi:hypothetical protein